MIEMKEEIRQEEKQKHINVIWSSKASCRRRGEDNCESVSPSVGPFLFLLLLRHRKYKEQHLLKKDSQPTCLPAFQLTYLHITSRMKFPFVATLLFAQQQQQQQQQQLSANTMGKKFFEQQQQQQLQLQLFANIMVNSLRVGLNMVHTESCLRSFRIPMQLRGQSIFDFRFDAIVEQNVHFQSVV